MNTMLKERMGDFIARCAKVNVHGMMISIGGEEKASVYWAPFHAGQPHRMYSVSKTMTALAVGMLAGDGKIDLDAPIVSYFPDYLPASPDPRLMHLKIRDMLRMATCYERTTYREGIDENWARTFFCGEATHEPGTCFHYDTSCSQVLAALVARVSGEQVIDFLDHRLFAPLGLQDERYWLRDPSGCCQGGTGLCMSLRDMHRVALMVMRGGEGLVPADFIREMTRRQIDTSMKTTPEERLGYGWQMWMHRGGWWMYGMGGQIAACWPEKQVLLCTIADTRLEPDGVHAIFAAFEELVLPYLEENGDAPISWTVEPKRHDVPADALERHHRFGPYRFETNMLGLKELALDGEVLRYENARGRCELPLALEARQSIAYPGWPEVPAQVAGRWIDPDVLLLRCYAIGDAPCGFEMRICFREKFATVQCRRSHDPVTVGYEGVATGYLTGEA